MIRIETPYIVLIADSQKVIIKTKHPDNELQIDPTIADEIRRLLTPLLQESGYLSD